MIGTHFFYLFIPFMVYTLSELQKAGYDRSSHFLVIGNPVSHSLSPLMHQAALTHAGISADYLALELEPHEISSFAAWCNRDSFLGCNITIPYKQQFMALVDEMDPAAEQIGAINTIAKHDGKVVGYNTDLFGFINPIEDLAHLIEGGRALIFGTGGASKAVQAGLTRLGVEEIIFVSRNPAGKITEDSDLFVRTVDYSQWSSFADEASIFVNTTPVGMHPKVDQLFFDERDTHYFADSICYDLIYNPEFTRFLQLAEQEGAVVINGLDMFIQQGSRSFEIWTGNPFPVEKIRSLLHSYFQDNFS